MEQDEERLGHKYYEPIGDHAKCSGNVRHGSRDRFVSKLLHCF